VTIDPATVPTEAPEPPAPLRRAPSLVLVHTGDGKGKSSAAFGTMLRALARGWRVAVVQFLKSDTWHVGEETIGVRLGVDWWQLGDGFTWTSTDLDRTQAIAAAAWEHAEGVLAAGAHELVILDEVTYPMNWGWIATDDVVAAIAARPAHVNVIATGRDAPAALVDVADTVTEMRNVRHAYERGVRAKRGIDY
jgi:cob(I)alamin adenosyltransferase